MTRNVVTRALVAFVGAIVALAGVLPVPAQAATTALIDPGGQSTSITVSGRTLVDVGEEVDSVWILSGQATIRGRVNGSVVVLNGGVGVSGSVDGDIVVVRGGVWVGPEGSVDGDIQASSEITLSEGSSLAGTSRSGSVFDGLQALIARVRMGAWIGLSVALVALGLIGSWLAPGTMGRARTALTDRPVGSGLRGGILLGVLPVLALIALAVFAGGVLGVLILTATAMVAVAGLAVSASAVGRPMLGRDRVVPGFIAGAVLLRVAALIPLLGEAITIAAAVVGTGAILLTLRERGAAEVTADGADRPDPEPIPLLTAPAAGSGSNDLDLRFGARTDPDERFAGSTGGTGWLDSLIAGPSVGDAPGVDVRRREPLIDLTASAPPASGPRPGVEHLGSPPAPQNTPPKVIASLPVREDNFADDPGATPGNGNRQSLFVDRPAAAGHNGVPLFRDPAPTAADASGVDRMRMPATGLDDTLASLWRDDRREGATPPSDDAELGVRDRLFVDDPTGPAEDANVDGIFAAGSRAWRPSAN